MDKKEKTSYEQKTKDSAIGCLVFIVIIVVFVIWAMGL